MPKNLLKKFITVADLRTQIAGLLYGAYGQKAFLGMFVVALVGMAAIVLLSRQWKGGLLFGAPLQA